MEYKKVSIRFRGDVSWVVLMSVFTYTEVSAEDELKRPKPFVCSVKYVGDYDMQHCETEYLDCAVTSGGRSCVKKDEIFK